MYHSHFFQTHYLSHLITHQKLVTLHLKSGRKLNGTVMGMTKDVIFFRSGMTEFHDKKIIYDILPQTPQTTYDSGRGQKQKP